MLVHFNADPRRSIRVCHELPHDRVFLQAPVAILAVFKFDVVAKDLNLQSAEIVHGSLFVPNAVVSGLCHGAIRFLVFSATRDHHNIESS